VTWTGEVKMTMLEARAGETEEASDSNSCASQAAGTELALPEEVVRQLAAGLAMRDRPDWTGPLWWWPHWRR
jgi:hypothetical protein